MLEAILALCRGERLPHHPHRFRDVVLKIDKSHSGKTSWRADGSEVWSMDYVYPNAWQFSDHMPVGVKLASSTGWLDVAVPTNSSGFLVLIILGFILFHLYQGHVAKSLPEVLAHA
mmetsp:Transcript_70936/g.167224  ORF Transcript_70936/g.167224 Transcript_70936/m.167224 type:complete len:116 (+) Transcript_70936:3-350(+)